MKIECITVGPFAMNCYLVYDQASRQGVVIDPGDEIDRIREAIRVHGVQITHILLTHGHIDHLAYAEDLHQELKVPMLLHPADRELAEQVNLQAMMFGLPQCRVPVIDGELQEGDRILSGPLSFEVLYTPGHSEGSVTLVLPEHQIAISGDVVFRDGVGRTDLPGGDARVLAETIRTKILTLDDRVTLYPGHGPITTVGRERAQNPVFALLRV